MKKSGFIKKVSLLLILCTGFVYSVPLTSFATNDVDSTDYQKNGVNYNIGNDTSEIVPKQAVSIVTVAAVVGIATSIVGLTIATYKVGQYVAKQCKVRLGLTSKMYKSNKWAYRAGLLPVLGPVALLGFDDYFYGI